MSVTAAAAAAEPPAEQQAHGSQQALRGRHRRDSCQRRCRSVLLGLNSYQARSPSTTFRRAGKRSREHREARREVIGASARRNPHVRGVSASVPSRRRHGARGANGAARTVTPDRQCAGHAPMPSRTSPASGTRRRAGGRSREAAAAARTWRTVRVLGVTETARWRRRLAWAPCHDQAQSSSIGDNDADIGDNDAEESRDEEAHSCR